MSCFICGDDCEVPTGQYLYSRMPKSEAFELCGTCSIAALERLLTFPLIWNAFVAELEEMRHVFESAQRAALVERETLQRRLWLALSAMKQLHDSDPVVSGDASCTR